MRCLPAIGRDQGAGAAIELPATLAILTHTFTGQRERAQAVGIWAYAAGSALVIGPVLGGGLVAAFGYCLETSASDLLGNTGAKGNVTAAQGHDHEGLVVLSRH